MDLGEGSVLAPVAAALAAVDVDVGVLSDAGLRRVLADAERLGAGLRALQARLVAEANRRDLARRDGAASPAAWLTTQLGISAGEAARRQDEATAVTASAAVADALDRGEITPEHARTIGTITATEPALDPGLLLADARLLDAGRFVARAHRLRRAHHVDSGLSDYESQRRTRRCSLRVRPDDGMVELRAELDPLTGARVRAALLSEADRLWRVEHGDHGSDVPGEARTNPQRLADALANIFARPPTTGLAPDTVDVLVTIDHRDLVSDQVGTAEVVGVGPIPAATARRLACHAGIIPAVLGGDSEMLDLGRRRRLATSAQRRALRHQHPTCAVDTCQVPYDWTQIHHLRPWATGGTTDLHNLKPVCTTHHHLLHEGGWTTTSNPDGTLHLHPPDSTEVGSRGC